jgi:hypothetical protein
MLLLLLAAPSAVAAESLASAARTVDPRQAYEPAALYPGPEALVPSPGKTVYFIDPTTGDDARAGTAATTAWRSFARLNALRLAPGDRVEVAPGLHPVSLKPSGGGTAARPVVIAFAAGTHVFGYDQAVRRTYFISNACDEPGRTKPIAILIDGAHHLLLQGADAAATAPQTRIECAGRMALFINDHATGITYAGLTFDLQRPTVSEFRVEQVTEHGAIIRVAEASTYEIAGGRFLWSGDWGIGELLCQEAQLAEGRTARTGTPKGWTAKGQELATAKALGERLVEFDFGAGASGLTATKQWQMRLITRDLVGAHNTRCKDITVRDCRFHALTNMGIVSQFTENLTFQRVDIVPPPGTMRSCPCWADCFHFSGCRGDILIDGCHVSGLQDDMLNVHGTHLQVSGKGGADQLMVRFANPQTFGFAAFQPGDEVAVIDHSTLRELPGNPRRHVTAVARQSDKDWLLTLDGAAPAFGPGDVIDNITWYPAVTVRDCHVDVESCRGLLLTTRGKVLVERCTFHRCHMQAISIEDDAEGWFESGPIRDLTLRGNTFTECGVTINPQNRSVRIDEPVHENIRIEGNTFTGAGIFAKCVRGLTVIGNMSTAGGMVGLELHDCSEVTTGP